MSCSCIVRVACANNAAGAPSIINLAGAVRAFENCGWQVIEPSGEQALKVTMHGPDVLQGVRDLAHAGLLGSHPPEPLKNLVLGIGVPCNEITLVRSLTKPFNLEP